MGLFRTLGLESLNNFKLYHYNTETFKELQSQNLQKQGPVVGAKSSDVVPKNVFDYENNISFFLEPIPIDLPSIFEGKHEFWKPGLKLVEHVITLGALPNNIAYRLVESPEKTKLLLSQTWSKETAKGNHEALKELEIKLGYWGIGLNNLEQAIKTYKKGLKGYYEKAYEISKTDPDMDILSKYASCVPHLMLYPGLIGLKVQSTKTITLR